MLFTKFKIKFKIAVFKIPVFYLLRFFWLRDPHFRDSLIRDKHAIVYFIKSIKSEKLKTELKMLENESSNTHFVCGIPFQVNSSGPCHARGWCHPSYSSPKHFRWQIRYSQDQEKIVLGILSPGCVILISSVSKCVAKTSSCSVTPPMANMTEQH